MYTHVIGPLLAAPGKPLYISRALRDIARQVIAPFV
jgi:hypothetical protein